MGWLVFICLMALAVNAVIIQTVVTDESSLKSVVRVGLHHDRA